MVLAALLGAPLGASVGLVAGSFIFSKISAKRTMPYLKNYDQEADDNPEIVFPQTAGQPVNFFKKNLLKDTSPALVQPDYERALFINKILQLLWPHLSPAIHKEVMKQARAPISEALAKIPLVEDIRIDRLDLGERPFRIDSFKTYQTMEDEIIIEAPTFWGGDMHIRATAVLKAGPLKIDVPVDISDISFKVLARITIKPLVETLPCVGGVTLALLEEPIIDLTVNILDSPDIMALPGVVLAVKAAVKLVAGKMLVYPNEFSVPLMPNFGLPPPPMGMLRVRVVSGHNLKSSFVDKVDPFVVLEVRKGRATQTTTINNDTDPVWNQDLDLVVDDPSKQSLKVITYDDDLVTPDTVGGVMVNLNTAEFMKNPHETITLRLPLYEPGEEGEFPEAGDDDLAKAVATAATDRAVAAAVAALPKRRGLIGKLRNKKAVKEATAAIVGAAASASPGHGGKPSSGGVSSTEGSVPATPRGEAAEEGEVVERGERPPPGTVTGSLTLEVTFVPFAVAQPPPTDVAQDAAAEAGTAPAAITAVRKVLLEQSFVEPSPKAKGVLTVDLKKVMHLGVSVDSYAVLRLYDPHRLPVPDIEVRTKVEVNESSPRFNFKTDFVNISASSVLILTVCKQPGMMAALTSLKVPFLQKAEAQVLGKVRISLIDVAKEGRVKDIYPLQEAQTGEMHLTLEWSAVALSGDAEEGEEE